MTLQDENVEYKFKEIYFHLYSNSNSSRSENILADVSKIIFLSILYKNNNNTVNNFLEKKFSANKYLIPELYKFFPNYIDKNDSFHISDNNIHYALNIINEIDIVSNPSHVLGDAFQALMGPRLRGDKGQFFTPRSVVRAMVKILSPQKGSCIIDPACGTGGFLSAVIELWRNNNIHGSIYGIDKDKDLYSLTSALSNINSESNCINIYNENSLNIKKLQSIGINLGGFDSVITNPPFGSKIGITDRDILSQFSLGYIWDYDAKKAEWFPTKNLRATQDPQILFIELCIRLLKEGGKMGIILPEGIFGNVKSGYVWDYIRGEGYIEGLIDCPRTTFQPGTDTKTNILFFTKTKGKNTKNECWVSVAYNCGHDKRGKSIKSDGNMVDDDFDIISKNWISRNNSNNVWNKISILNKYYLIPRYYDKCLSKHIEEDAFKLNSNTTTIGKLIDEGMITIRKGHEVGSDVYGSGDIPFIRTSDIHNFEISYDPTNCISEDIYKKYSKQQNLKSGDILMVVDGRYKIGRCAILHKWTEKCVVQSHVRIISLTGKAKFSPMALLYSLSLSSVQKEIRRLVFIQSTLGSIGARINEIRIPDPRESKKWGDNLFLFEEAINIRAEKAYYLKSFTREVDL